MAAGYRMSEGFGGQPQMQPQFQPQMQPQFQPQMQPQSQPQYNPNHGYSFPGAGNPNHGYRFPGAGNPNHGYGFPEAGKPPAAASDQYHNSGTETIQGNTVQTGTFKGHGAGAKIQGGFIASGNIQ